MDATYKDTVSESLQHNPFISFDKAENLANFITQFYSESICKSLCKNDDKGRFFYKENLQEITKKVQSIYGDKRNQMLLNKWQQMGNITNPFTNEIMPNEYRTKGHLYRNGKRIY